MDNSGFIYALINTSLEGLIKVGKTSREPKDRANELSKETGVPTPFIVAYEIYVSDCNKAEKYLHTLLENKGYRLSENKEFFKIELKHLLPLMQKVKEKHNKEKLKSKINKKMKKEGEINNLGKDLFQKGLKYFNGKGEFLQDYKMAIKFLKKAANVGFHEAYKKLGYIYKRGLGCRQNLNRALEYYTMYAHDGYCEGFYEMAKIYIQEEKTEEAKKVFNEFRKCNNSNNLSEKQKLELESEIEKRLFWLELEEVWREILWHNIYNTYEGIDSINLDDLEFIFNKLDDIRTNLEVKNLNPLKRLTKLYAIDFSDNNIKDVKPLKRLKYLKRVVLSNNMIDNIEPIKYLENLEKLKISGNNLNNIKSLSNLTKLENLDISNNKIGNLKNVKNLRKIEKLDFANNKVIDIGPLIDLKELEVLNISQNPIDNFKILNSLKNLSVLICSKIQFDNLIEDIKFSNLECIYCEGILHIFNSKSSDDVQEFIELSKRNGRIIEYYDNGIRKIEKEYKKGMINGDWIEYRKNGSKRIHKIYNHGVLRKIINFYDNDIKKNETNYNFAGKKIGNRISYYKNGNFKREVKPTGYFDLIVIKYYENGNVKIRKEYSLGVLNNIIEYDENGNIKNEKIHKN